MTSGPTLPPPEHDAPLPPGHDGPDGIHRILGVPYAATPPGIRPRELDLYRPATDEPVPLVVFLHGGGWRAGSRRSAGPAYARLSPTPFERVAQAGIAVASVDYRLSGEARWPAQLHDVKAAVRWLRSRAGELGIDADRIAAWGESAGGHLAALLGVTGSELDGDVGVRGPSAAVCAVAAWYPPTDLLELPGDNGADAMAGDSREALLLGGPLPTLPELARQASPVAHVSAAAPPFLLLHGRADRLVSYRQSDRLRDALAAVGASVDLELYDKADHMWLDAPAAASAALERTISFLTAATGR